MEAVNGMLANAIRDEQISNLQTIQKIVQKLGKATDGDSMSETEVNNWLSYFLPLLFNNNKEIRVEVIHGMDLLIPRLYKTQYQEFFIWKNIRKEIVETYSNNIKNLFNQNQEEWHLILRILLRILDSVIAHSTAAINTFLAIIEMGFRSTDLKVRADAFLCWKVVIEIFIKFDQISDPKRIKLICIPLKSSRSKTQEIAENKFDVWWTLIQALDDKIIDHSHLIESFIFFCLGPFGKQKEPLVSYFDEAIRHLTSPGKLFNSLRDLSITALIYILGNPNRAAIRLAKKTNLVFQDNLHVCSDKLFEQVGIILIAACIESTVLISKLETAASEINDCLWESLLKYIKSQNVIKYRRFIIDGLISIKKLLEKEENGILKQLFVNIICMITKHQPFIDDASNTEISQIVEIIDAFADEFKTKQIQSVPPSIRNRTQLAQKNTNKAVKAGKNKKEEYVVIPKLWKMNPDKLTEHQLEKMKERRSDIPALYNDMSQSQDTVQLKPWSPKQVIVAGTQSNDTVVLNDSSNTNSNSVAKSPKKAVQSPKKAESENNDEKGSARRKGTSRPMKNVNNEIKNLAIDTVQGKELMKHLNKIPARRNSLDRGAKFAEPAWKKSLLPNKRHRKSRSTSEESNSSKSNGGSSKASDPIKSSPKKALIPSAQNELNVQSVDIKPSPKELKDAQANSQHDDSNEVVEISQDVLPKTPQERRLSRREFLNSSKTSARKVTDSPTNTKSPKKDVSPASNDNARSLRCAVKPDQSPKINTTNEPMTPIKQSFKPPENQTPVIKHSPSVTSRMNTKERSSNKESPEVVARNATPTKEETVFKKPEDINGSSSTFDRFSQSPKKPSEKALQTSKTIKSDESDENARTPETPILARTPEKMSLYEAITPIAIPITRNQLTPVRCSPRKPSGSGDTLNAIVPLPIEWPKKSSSPTEGSTPTNTDDNLKELRRSPRKPQTEFPENAGASPGGKMAPLRMSPPIENKDSPDRRKSPRKLSEPKTEETIEENTPPSKKRTESLPIKLIREKTELIFDLGKENVRNEDEFRMEVDDEDDEPIDLLTEVVQTSPPSPAPNLDEQLEPIDRSMTVVTSPDTSFSVEKTNEFMNNTLDISPILTGKSSPVTRLAAKNNQSAEPSTSPTTTQERKVTRATALTNQVSGIMNLESPKTGRAARIMNMLFKNNSSTPNPQQQPGTSKSFTMKPPKTSDAQRDILVFSKTLPAPDASPSASILKRKLDDSTDDIESPANKRKRVSFHDPPVSITKEYIRHEEEIRSPSVRPPINRCLLMASINQQNGPKAGNLSPMNQLRYTLKRKGKRDSRVDLMRFSASSNSSTIINAEPSQTQNDINQEDIETDAQNIDAVSMTNDQEYQHQSQSEMHESKDASIRFGNKSEVLQFVLNSYPLEEVLDVYFEENKPLTPKAARIMFKELSNQMETDSKLRYSFFDRLSEKHPLEFLDHALQENNSKTICERLTLPVILNHISEKISSDQAAKVNILKQFELMITGDEQTVPELSRHELITFLINIMPEEMTRDEITLMLDELFGEKTGAELYDIFTVYFRKYFVSE